MNLEIQYFKKVTTRVYPHFIVLAEKRDTVPAIFPYFLYEK
jgi:hypothetical protein